MRIVAGALRGRRLGEVPHAGVRPTPDRVREAVFNILGQHLDDMSFLDLFAGTGAMGLEAASRGARRSTLVEADLDAFATCEANIRALGVEDRVRAIRGDAARVARDLAEAGEAYDVVFADPPYGDPPERTAALVEQIDGSTLLEADGVLVLQMKRGLPLPAAPRLALQAPRYYGITTILVYERPT